MLGYCDGVDLARWSVRRRDVTFVIDAGFTSEAFHREVEINNHELRGS